mmetsp:Transcript_100830/g.194964  ORF Transcript_100830/g.194964 Transcript_100830/m.194964 type:complete len:720 (+) Transcript_100830:44-2203(+)
MSSDFDELLHVLRISDSVVLEIDTPMFVCFPGKAIHIVKYNSGLQGWTLSTNMGDDACVRVAEALKANSVLQSLSLTIGGKVGNDAFVVLATTMSEFKSLRSLSLVFGKVVRGQFFGLSAQGDEAGVSMAAVVEQNSLLQTLNLQLCNSMGDRTGTALADALKNQTSLDSLALTLPYGMNDSSGEALAGTLKNTKTLRSLSLGGFGNMGNRTGVAMASVLEANRLLRSLSWTFSSHMDDETGVAVAHALKSNAKFQSLSLSLSLAYKMGDKTASALADALKGNADLQSLKLELSWQHETLIDAFQGKKSLQSLVLKFKGSVEDDTCTCFADALQQMTSLQSLTLDVLGGNDFIVAVANVIKRSTSILLFEFWRRGGDEDDPGVSALAKREMAAALEENKVLQNLCVYMSGGCYEAGEDWLAVHIKKIQRRIEMSNNRFSIACFLRHASRHIPSIVLEDGIRRSVLQFLGPERMNYNSEDSANLSINMSEDNASSEENEGVIERVEHLENPAIVDEEEARAVSDLQWSTGVQRLLTDSFDPPELPREIVVLALTRHSQDIENKILQSTLAKKCMQIGIDVQPSWARGAKVFVDAFNGAVAEDCRLTFGQHIGLGPNHVVVEANDEHLVLSALREERGRRALATVKPGGRFVVPQSGNTQWFMCSERSPSTWWSNDSNAASSEALAPTNSCSLHVIVKNTFIHLEGDVSETSGRSPRSAPF